MVYRGKPSKGCNACRRKKIKCAQERPRCQQCERAGQVCPGYRDQLNLMFCDESKKVVDKARARREHSQNRSVPPIEQEQDTIGLQMSPKKSNDDGPVSAPLSARSLPLDVEEIATQFFFANYVFQANTTRGHLCFLPNLFLRRGADEGLSTAVVAVGTAALAYSLRSKPIKLMSRQKYGLALALTNAALQDPAHTLEDETLASIRLLGLYETITCNSQQSLSSWHNHMAGATTLIRLRGPQQFQNITGLQLFLDLRNQIITGCLQKGISVPEPVWQEIQRPRQAQVLQSVNELWADKLVEIIARFCYVRARKEKETVMDLPQFVATYLELDDDFEAWASSSPSNWYYSTVETYQSSDNVLDGHCDVYDDPWAANVWNAYRCSRILIHEALLDHLMPFLLNEDMGDPTFFATQYSKSSTIIRSLTSEICASVPCRLGIPPEAGEVCPPQAVCSLYLIWPLYLAGVSEVVCSSARTWAIERMKHIGEAMGIRQASALAGVLLRRKTKVWTAKLCQRQMVSYPAVSDREEEGCKCDRIDIIRLRGRCDRPRISRYMVDAPDETSDVET